MNEKKNRRIFIIILCGMGVLLIGIGIYLVITEPNYQEIVNNVFDIDIPFLDSSTNETEEEEEVLPSDLKGMVKSSTPFENWDKYTNTQYVDIVQDLNYDSSSLNNPNPEDGILLVYIYYNSKTGGRVGFSAYDKYTEDSLVESIFEAIINDTSEICPSKFYEVSGGSKVKGNWALHSFTPQKHPGALDTAEDYHQVHLISFKDESNKWKTFIQGSDAYNDKLLVIPDDMLDSIGKSNFLISSQKMNEEGCYNF